MLSCLSSFLIIISRLIQGKANKQASSILSLGRAISPSNTLLLFLDSYVHYLQQDTAISQQVYHSFSSSYL